jgi:hypothetical protein
MLFKSRFKLRGRLGAGRSVFKKKRVVSNTVERKSVLLRMRLAYAEGDDDNETHQYYYFFHKK